MVMNSEIIRTESIAQGKLTYEIIKTVETGIPVYGIRIASKLFDKTEENLVTNITVNIKTAETLFNLCIANTVLPSSLLDITEDFIISDEMSA
jgi:hypothetical protein